MGGEVFSQGSQSGSGRASARTSFGQGARLRCYGPPVGVEGLTRHGPRNRRAILPLHSKPAVGRWPWPATDQHGDLGVRRIPRRHRAHTRSGRVGQSTNPAMPWTGRRHPLSGTPAADSQPPAPVANLVGPAVTSQTVRAQHRHSRFGAKRRGPQAQVRAGTPQAGDFQSAGVHSTRTLHSPGVAFVVGVGREGFLRTFGPPSRMVMACHATGVSG